MLSSSACSEQALLLLAACIPKLPGSVKLSSSRTIACDDMYALHSDQDAVSS